MTKTILVVEDDQEIRQSIQDYLSIKGYKVITASDGWTCLRTVVEKKPDLILMDINMPKLSGLNVLDLIKVTRLKSHTPIVVMSAKADRETVLTAGKLGADDFIEKPFSFEYLAHCIHLQLLNFSLNTFHQLLSSLGTAENHHESSFIARHPEYNNKQIFKVEKEGVEMKLILPHDTEVKTILELSIEEMSERVIILAKANESWKQIFPRQNQMKQRAA